MKPTATAGKRRARMDCSSMEDIDEGSDAIFLARAKQMMRTWVVRFQCLYQLYCFLKSTGNLSFVIKEQKHGLFSLRNKKAEISANF